MYTYLIIDDTEIENIYFTNEIKARAYFNSHNHTMTLYINKSHDNKKFDWKQIDYRKCSKYYVY